CRWIQSFDELNDDPVLSVISLGEGDPRIIWGKPDRGAASEALESLQAASNAALMSNIDGIITAPVNKYAIGTAFHGQTDFLAAQSGRTRYAMAFFAPTFKVVLATVHISLRQAIARISTELYLDLIRFVHSEMQRFRFAQPRIAVAA